MRRLVALRKRQAAGQSLVEFALALPLLTLFILAVIQVSLLFVAFYSEARMARESARWLAIRATTTIDSDFATHVHDGMLPGLVSGTTLTASPNVAGDTVSTIGQYMTVTFSGCNLTSSTSTPCGAPSRAPGATLSVEMKYDARPLIFLPTTFAMGKNLVVKIPTTLPPYRVSVMVE